MCKGLATLGASANKKARKEKLENRKLENHFCIKIKQFNTYVHAKCVVCIILRPCFFVCERGPIVLFICERNFMTLKRKNMYLVCRNELVWVKNAQSVARPYFDLSSVYLATVRGVIHTKKSVRRMK